MPRLTLTHNSKVICLLLIFFLGTASCTSLKQWAYEGHERDTWQHPDKVIEALKIQPGDKIADLGSGSGYFTIRLAEATGPTGTVYAVDVDEDMNDIVKEKAKNKGYKNIETILAKPQDPNLTDGSIDLVFASNSYHHLKDRVQYFANLKNDLKPEGRVAIIDFTHEPSAFLHGHSTTPDVIQQELEEAGYSLKQQFDFLPRQGFLIFKRN